LRAKKEIKNEHRLQHFHYANLLMSLEVTDQKYNMKKSLEFLRDSFHVTIILG
jgi:hypothetical protein